MLVLFVAALAVTAASQGATVVAVSNVHLGRPITIGGALGRIRPRIASLAVTMVVLGIGAALGFLLLVVPGLILTLMWSLAIPVAVLEERSMLDAASRSTELTKGSRMRVALVYGLFALVVFLVSGVMSIPLMVGAFASGSIAPPAPMPAWLQVGNIVTSYLSQCLAAPLMTIGLALLYYDQRVRKEAFDVELMMAALDGQPADYTA
jgi:hypothetical protein